MICGYRIGYAVLQLIKQCGDNLTGENNATLASDMKLPLPLPRIRLKTRLTDSMFYQADAAVCFDGERYLLFSDLLASE